MRNLTYVMLLAVAVAVPAIPAAAQSDPSDPAYYRQWLRSQLDEWQTVTRVEFRERTRRKVDNPFGVNTAEVVATVTAYPEDREYDRDVLEAKINGRRVPPHRVEEFTERWQQFNRQLGREVTSIADWRIRVLAATRPTGRPRLERFDGRPAYRVDLVPTENRMNIDRITLWFDRESGNLLGSRSVFKPRGQRSSLIVESRFRRVDGIDVPEARTIKGTVQTRRRLRHFTTLIDVESTFDRYSFQRERD